MRSTSHFSDVNKLASGDTASRVQLVVCTFIYVTLKCYFKSYYNVIDIMLSVKSVNCHKLMETR